MADVSFLWHYGVSRTLGLLPWFMLAVLLGALLQHLRVDVWTKGSLRHRTAAAALSTTVFGAMTPFCACSIVPLIRSFLAAGVPVSVVMAFWVASPAMAPEIFGLTASAFGFKIAVARLVGAIMLAMTASTVARLMENRGMLRDVLRVPTKKGSRAGLQRLQLRAQRDRKGRNPLGRGGRHRRGTAPSASSRAGLQRLQLRGQRDRKGRNPLGRGGRHRRGTAPSASRISFPPQAVLVSVGSTGSVESMGTLLPSSISLVEFPADPVTGSLLQRRSGLAVPQGGCCDTEDDSTAAAGGSACCGASTPDPDMGAAGGGGCCGTDGLVDVNVDPDIGVPWRILAKRSLREANLWDFGSGALRSTWLMGRWMLFAILIEAVVVRFVPPEAFRGLLGGNVVISVIVAALLSVPLYLNGISAIPIGASLLSLGMSPAGITTFMLAGAITTIPAMAGVKAVVHRHVFLLYLATGILGSIAVGLASAPFVD